MAFENLMGAKDCSVVISLVRLVRGRERQHYKIQKHAPGSLAVLCPIAPSLNLSFIHFFPSEEGRGKIRQCCLIFLKMMYSILALFNLAVCYSTYTAV